jgi:hypothetical protein
MPAGDEAHSDRGHLPDNAVVIRGGVMRRGDLIASVRKYAVMTGGVYGLTAWSWPDMDAAEIALRVKATHPLGRNPVAHGSMRVSTAGTIRTPGTDGKIFRLVKTGAEGHYTLTFPAEPTDADWERVENMFGPAQPNPAAD